MRYAIGFNPSFFEQTADDSNFPPHNIVQVTDDVYRLTLAVAGFSEAELDITMHNDILTVVGAKHQNSAPEGFRLLYNGIAFRDFTRQFKVGEHVHVDVATLKDGLLKIELVRLIPETMKPKRIAINIPPVAYEH
jgi:molecular chaperone IbpA